MIREMLMGAAIAGNMLTAEMAMEETMASKKKGSTGGGVPTNLIAPTLPAGYVLLDGTTVATATLVNALCVMATLVCTIQTPLPLKGKQFKVVKNAAGKYVPA